MPDKIKVAILGSGNIGTDLMIKILNRGQNLEMSLLAGIDPDSEGLARARSMGVATSDKSIDAVLADKDIKIVFDATSAQTHAQHAPLLKEAGKIAIDLTPAAVGPYVVPVINLDSILDTLGDSLSELNMNMITCGGQATIPIVYAISRVTGTPYAEIVATLASKSAGPGTRMNIDEFTETTADGVVKLGGAEKGKAIILLNPAEPPMMMNCTIYARCHSYPQKEIIESVNQIVSAIQKYVPGYRVKVPPQFPGDRVTVIVQVTGAGDFLPVYAGNLDIMNCAAFAVAEKVAGKLLA
jgi:acetaldehyde dehydrogenase